VADKEFNPSLILPAVAGEDRGEGLNGAPAFERLEPFELALRLK